MRELLTGAAHAVGISTARTAGPEAPDGPPGAAATELPSKGHLSSVHRMVVLQADVGKVSVGICTDADYSQVGSVMIRARCYGTGLALPGPVRLTTGSPHLVTCSCCTVIGW